MFARFNKWTEFPFRSLSNRQDPIWTRERKSKYFIKRVFPRRKIRAILPNSVSSYILVSFFFFLSFLERKNNFDEFSILFFLFFFFLFLDDARIERGDGWNYIIAYWIFKLAYDKFRVQSEVNLLGKMLYRSIEINFTRYRITLHRITLL